MWRNLSRAAERCCVLFTQQGAAWARSCMDRKTHTHTHASFRRNSSHPGFGRKVDPKHSQLHGEGPEGRPAAASCRQQAVLAGPGEGAGRISARVSEREREREDSISHRGGCGRGPGRASACGRGRRRRPPPRPAGRVRLFGQPPHDLRVGSGYLANLPRSRWKRPQGAQLAMCRVQTHRHSFLQCRWESA